MSPSTQTPALWHALAEAVHPLQDRDTDFDPLLERVGDARFVLLGEASHGTHEFYRARALLTRRLVEEKGFQALAVEADWPDAWRANRFVQGRSADRTPAEALRDFGRFPAWMWRNTDVVALMGWLRTHNTQGAPDRVPVGFYGLDLYSLHSSMAAVLVYLDEVDPRAAAAARERYACFDEFGDSPQDYGRAVYQGLGSCEDDVVRQLTRRASDGARRMR
jgi:erythromycin esterase-like protein